MLIGDTSKIEVESWMCWFLRRGENRSTRRKTSRSKNQNQQQTQPTYDTGTRNRTRATLVGGKCLDHCAILAPHNSHAIGMRVCGVICSVILSLCESTIYTLCNMNYFLLLQERMSSFYWGVQWRTENSYNCSRDRENEVGCFKT